MRFVGTPADARTVEIEDGHALTMTVHIVEREIHMTDAAIQCEIGDGLLQAFAWSHGLLPPLCFKQTISE